MKDLHRVMRRKRKDWILDGRPRGNAYFSYREYKNSKRVFRQYHRKSSENYLKTLNEEIDNAAELDGQYFWKLVGTRRNNSPVNIGKEIRFGNRSCRDPHEICNQWGCYFSSLYSETEGACFDTVHYNNVTTNVRELKERIILESDVNLITEQELNDTIDRLNRGK
ncbi:MAG: hypothetical protein N0C90_01355, partial [Candidatus Thiodiazotropha endolucinida]|nr:hypothetical protein [Candidatus Thiodiazotropha taylori]MCW4259994.1 hypothetical protein [Candidatus Thiodiazotropha endolucinida]